MKIDDFKVASPLVRFHCLISEPKEPPAPNFSQPSQGSQRKSGVKFLMTQFILSTPIYTGHSLFNRDVLPHWNSRRSPHHACYKQEGVEHFQTLLLQAWP